MTDPFAHGYALLVGVDQNRVPGWELPAVALDVAALHKVLTHPQRCAYPPEQVRLLCGPNATGDGILDGLDWLQAAVQADPEATAVVYYSGHGWRDTRAPGEFFLVPYDAREERLRRDALRASDLQARIAALAPRRLLVVLDCCHAAGLALKAPSSPLPSGEGPGVRVPPGAPPAGYQPFALPPAPWLAVPAGAGVAKSPISDAKGLETLARGDGRAVLSSSTGEQRSRVRSDRTMSVFTYHLIEALTGHAQPQEGASEVLVSDLMGHVTRRVPETVARYGHVQTPRYEFGGDNFPVALLLGGEGLAKGVRPPDPLEDRVEPAVPTPSVRIDTGGGMYVGGSVINSGVIAGRDYIAGDHVSGDKIGGDQVAGDKIVTGPIRDNAGLALGREGRVKVSQAEGLGGDELARLFEAVYARIEARPPEPDVGQEELVQAVSQIEGEAALGEQANPRKLERWLRTLALMADDIFDVVAACLVSPAAGVAAVIRNVVQKVKQDAGQASD